jgi:hypothetical protein
MYFVPRCVGQSVPNLIIFPQPISFEMQTETHGQSTKFWQLDLIPYLPENSTAIFGSFYESLNFWDDFGFFGLYSSAAFAPNGETVREKNGEQRTDNAAQNSSGKDGISSRFYFFSHLISATIAGIVASCVMWLWFSIGKPKILTGFIDAPLFANGNPTGKTVRFKTKTSVSLQ